MDIEVNSNPIYYVSDGESLFKRMAEEVTPCFILYTVVKSVAEDIPDLWITAIRKSKHPYTSLGSQYIKDCLTVRGYVDIGWYRFRPVGRMNNTEDECGFIQDKTPMDKMMLFINNDTLREEKDWLYILTAIVLNYGSSYQFTAAAKGRVISNDTVSRVVANRGDTEVVEYVTTKVIERPKSNNLFVLTLKGIPASLTALGPAIGVSRQSLAPYKDRIKKIREQGEMRSQLVGHFVKYPFTVMTDLMQGLTSTSLVDKHKELFVKLYMINSILYYKNSFNKGYAAIAEDCGVSYDLIVKVIKNMINDEIIYVRHKGNNIQHMPTSYGLTDSFKARLKSE